jgi:sugar/nucleoside kinase (ribokinase family)
MAEPRILVVGDITIDVIVKPEGPLERGTDCWSEIHTLPGGSGANQAMWLAVLGTKVRFAGRVGAADVVAYAERFEARGVEAHLTGDSLVPTSTVVAVVDPDGERSFYTDRGANETLNEADLPFSLLAGVTHLQISGYSLYSPTPRDACLALLAEAQRRGLTTSVDPASTAFLREAVPANFLNWTAGATLIFPNREEAELLTGRTELVAQMQALSAHYGKVVIKLGEAGAAAGGRDGLSLQLDAPHAEVVDSTGAGDAFLAGYLSGFVAGANEEECLAKAVEMGAVGVGKIGAQPD